MARKARRNDTNSALVRLTSVEKPGTSIDELGCMIQDRDVSEKAKATLDSLLLSLKPGTHGVFKLVRAADEIEDGDFLFQMAKLGFPEALGAHTMERLILDEAPGAIVPLVEAQAAMIASAPRTGAYVMAEFGESGDALAVNGSLMVEDGDKIPARPRDYVLGGSSQVEVRVELDTKIVAKKLAALLGLVQFETEISEILEDAFGPKIRADATGDVHVWTQEPADVVLRPVFGDDLDSEEFYGQVAANPPVKKKPKAKKRRSR